MRLLDDSSSADDRGRDYRDASSDDLTLNGERAYVVRDIRDDRLSGRRKGYLVVWDGYSSSEASWVPAKDVNLFARKLYNAKKLKKS